MKIAMSRPAFFGIGLRKIALCMKLFAVFMLAACLQVSAKGFGQNKVTLQLKSANLKEALHQLEKKAGIRFLYNDALISDNQKVDINANNEALEKVLTEMFLGTSIQYKMMEDNLVVLSAGTDDKDNPVQVIRGKVTGTNGEAIAGASVVVKGTKNGTSTNASGDFAISADDAATLVISYVGFETKQETVNGRTVINIQLQESTSTRTTEDVVVIGYGVANRRDLTGSIVKIAGKEVADKPNSNPVASLQSKVAGLSVVNNGTPGSAPDIRIRGTVSIGQVHPLYVIDGIFEDNLDFLNPNDIESIEVLKDPSSLAIFGVKGATGVIAITTKRAKTGQTTINFNTYYGFKKLVDKVKLANADQFKTLFAEENANNGITTPFDYTGLTANTDWIDAVTRTASTSNSNLSISGSSEKNRFNLNLGYNADEGIVKHQKLERMSLAFSDELKVSKAIKVGVNLNVARQNIPFDANSVLDNARKVVPLVSAETKQFKIVNPYGTDSINANLYSGLNTALQNSGVVNPLIQLENEWDKTINIEYRSVGSVYAEIAFLKNFTFRSTVYADMSTVNKRQYVPQYNAYNPVTNTPYLYSANTSVQENDDNYRKFQQDHILSYKKTFGDHSLTATAGFTTYYFGHFGRQGKSSQVTGAAALPIPNDPRFWYVSNFFQDPSTTSASSSQSEYSTVSALARVLYNYKAKYFLNASFRDDASSQIPAANRHQQFWAVGAAWDVTKEDFMKNQHMFDFLKIKGSVGVLGNQTATDKSGNALNYPFYPNLNTGANAVFGTNVRVAATPAYTANPNLKWETVSGQEIGIELNSFQNRLHFEANYYNKTTNNLMTYVSRASLGIPDELINGGSIRNWGEEFSATWNQKISRDFSINIGGNITFQKNEVLSLAADVPNGVLDITSQNNGQAISEAKAGMPIGFFKGLVVTGVYQSYKDILSSPSEGSLGTARPGDLKYKDLNGDGQVTGDDRDRTMIGNPSPKFYYGGSVNLNYKGFTLGVDVGGVAGNQIFRAWGALESPFQRVNYAGFELDRWHGAGTSNWVPLLSQGDRINYVGSTYSIEDGSYFRIRNIQLGYAFSSALMNKINVKGLRVFANVQNPKTWKHNSGYTPEYGGNAISFGYDTGGGAIPVVATMGLNVTF